MLSGEGRPGGKSSSRWPQPPRGRPCGQCWAEFEEDSGSAGTWCVEEAESSRMGKTAGNMWRDRERLDELGRIRGEEEEMNLRLSPSGSVAERKRDLSHERCHPYRDPPNQDRSLHCFPRLGLPAALQGVLSTKAGGQTDRSQLSLTLLLLMWEGLLLNWRGGVY